MRIAIVGLDLTTTAIARALNATSGDFSIVGHDPDEERVQRANQMNAIDSSHWNIPAACEGADLIILSISLNEMEQILQALAPDLSSTTVIIDVGLLKRPAARLAQEILGDDASRFVGCSLTTSAMSSAYEDPSTTSLEGAIFRIAADSGVTGRALDVASNLAAAIGAEIEYIDLAEHDGLMAATVQLPYVCALGLAQALAEEEGSRERSRAVGAECLALASMLISDGAPSAEELLTNANNLTHWIERQVESLGQLHELLREGNREKLQEQIDKLKAVAEEWLQEEPAGNREDDQRPQSFWRQMLLGRLGNRRSEK